MKKIFITLLGALMLLCGQRVNAQISDIDGTWSFGGGFTGMSVTGSDAELLKTAGFPSMVPGFYFGASIDYAFSAIEGLTVEPGAYIAHYGKSFKFGLADDDKPYHANYLRIPVNLRYAFPMGDSSLGITVFTGPRINIGVGGNMFSAGKTYPGIKPLDAQWGFGLAFTIQDAIVINGGYDLGITNCLKNNKDLGIQDEIARRNSFVVGVNFMFK